MDWLLKHKIAAIVIIVIVTGLAWYMLSGSSSSSSDAVLATENVEQIPPEAQDLLNSLTALQAVTLSSQIFSNPAFQSMQDFSTPITPEPVGRTNPFVPLHASSRIPTAPTSTGAR